MATEEERILTIKVDNEKAVSKIAEYKSKIDRLKIAERELQEEFKKGKMSRNQYNEQLSELTLKTKGYNEQIRLLTKEINNNIKSDYSKSTSLRGLRAALSNVTAEYDNLSREEREAASGRALLDKINKITVELKEAEAATQRYYRNVGNYSSVFNGLGISIQQVARELPSLAYGFNMFVSAISNNLPMLADEIARARKEYNELVKAGKQATPVWKQILGSIFSWQTALVAGVTILTLYGKEILNWVKSLLTGREAIEDTYASTEEFQKSVGDISGSMIADLQKLSEEWESLGGSLKEQQEFIEQNQKEFKKLGVSIESVSDAENALVKNKDAFIRSITQKAKASAVMDIAAEKYKEAITKMMEAEEMPDKVRTTINTGNQYQANWQTVEYDNQNKKDALADAQAIWDAADKLVEDAVALEDKSALILNKAGIKIATETKTTMESLTDATEKELQAIRDMEDALTAIIKIEQERTKVEVETKYDEEIAALRKRLAEEVSLNEEAQSKILATIEATEQKKRELMNSFGVDMSAYEEQRRALAKVYDDDIRQLSERLQEEVDLTDEARKEILAIIEEKEKAKAVLMVSVNADDKAFEKQKEMVISGYDEEIQALRKKLSEEKSLTEEAKNEILSIIETKEAAKRALSVDTSDNSEYFTKQIELIAKAYDNEIELLRNKLATEKDLTEKAQSDILSIIEAKEAEKREAVARVSIMDADLEEERQRTILAYDREIEDLKKRLETEKDLTEKARDAIIETIRAKEIQKENELDKLNDEAIAREIERQQKLIETQLEGVKEGTEAEHNLRVAALEKQREAELANKELTEQMKLAIVQKYEKLMNDEAVRYSEATAKAQSDAIKQQFDTAIAKAYGNELEISRLKMEQKKAELDAIQQMEGESLEAFNLRKLEAENEYLDAKQELRDKEVEIEQSKLQAMSDVTGGLISLMEAIGEENKAMAVASKVLALAQIAIDTGRAISAGVAEAVKIGFPQNIAAIATTVATVLANIATAIKTVKSAKFATGGDVIGAGTGTSDSVPAMLSNGESVLTAKATSMFAPILSAFNQAGGGVPINGQQTGNQAMGEEMLARAFAKGVANMPNPIVSVEEISTVTNRVKVIENINRI